MKFTKKYGKIKDNKMMKKELYERTKRRRLYNYTKL